MVKPEKFDHLHLVYLFTAPISDLRRHRLKHNLQCADNNLFPNLFKELYWTASFISSSYCPLYKNEKNFPSST